MLPLISSFTAASSGPHGSLSNATADMICPEVQYPHWYPSHATNAACIGCNASGEPRPSIVVISSPSCIRAKLRHEFTRLPFTCAVHAPHWPWSQPFFVPVRATVSRRQSRSVVRGSTRSWRSLPLMRSVIGTAPSMFGPAVATASSFEFWPCRAVPFICTYFPFVLSLAERHALHWHADAAFNPFLVPSIREYMKDSSQTSRHLLHNAQRNRLPRDQPRQHLSNLKRCRGNPSGVQKASATQLSPVFRSGHSG